MRVRVFFIALFITVTLHGQQNEALKDGYYQFKYPNGAVSSEGKIRNGKPDGYWRSYYITGVLKSEGKRTSYLLDSIWVFYDQSGDTLEKISYLLGKKNGYYYKYQKDPVVGLYVALKELYAGDVREGVAMTFYPEGDIRQTIPYNKSKRDGLSKEYDREGKIITLLEYRNDFLISRENINGTDRNGLKQGKWLDFYENGNIKAERNYKDDLLHGYYKEYNEKGKLILALLYDEGKVTEKGIYNGEEIEIVNKYNEQGKLIYSGPYREGIPVGIHREYNEEGRIVKARIYGENGAVLSEGIIDEAGNRSGPWKDYSAEGKTIAEGQYTDNKRSGVWKFFGTNEKLEQTGSYLNGRINGTWRWYYPSGELLREEDYFQGQRDGLYTEYAKNGDVIAQGNYANGERTGEWKFTNGDNLETGNYIMGLRDGIWKDFYASGELRFKGSYINGEPDGKHLLFYENGKVMEERNYRNGMRNKTWKKYNQEGEITLSVLYKNDVEISVNGVKVSLPEAEVKLIN